MTDTDRLAALRKQINRIGSEDEDPIVQITFILSDILDVIAAGVTLAPQPNYRTCTCGHRGHSGEHATARPDVTWDDVTWDNAYLSAPDDGETPVRMIPEAE